MYPVSTFSSVFRKAVQYLGPVDFNDLRGVGEKYAQCSSVNFIIPLVLLTSFRSILLPLQITPREIDGILYGYLKNLQKQFNVAHHVL
uniref:Uncharacterized protein n=1 Tax=Caenorhabditis japonica TaxID=281687 RepID=A0A8R1ESU8_CAEJA